MIAQGESSRAQIDRILQSEALRSSDGLRRLLKFLADKSISGEADQLKEFSIGIDAFGKPPTYDPRHDSTVRIQVGRLRQKLTEYYQTEGKDDPIVVELPKGRFKLNWQERPATMVSFTCPALAPAPEPSIPPARPERRALFVTAAALILVSVVAVYSALQLRQERLETAVFRAGWTPEIETLWGPFIAADRPLILSISAPLFVDLPGLGVFRGMSLNRVEDIQKSPAVATLQRTFRTAPPQPFYYYSTIGDVNVTFLLGKLLAARIPHVSVVNGTELSWTQLSENNVVLIGSPKFFNQQLASLPVKPELILEPRNGIHNYHPQAGEPAIFVDQPGRDRSSGVTYALVSHTPGPLGKGDVMSFSGRNGAGVMGAVRCFTEPGSARGLLSRMRKPSGETPRYYQALLKIEFQDGVPLQTSYVLHRELRAMDAPK